MSLNLVLIATGKLTLEGGKVYEVSERFDLSQTPTQVTKQALDSGDPKSYYIKWFEDLYKDDPYDLYPVVDHWDYHNEDFDDIIRNHPERIVEWRSNKQDHIDELNNWIKEKLDLGLKVEWGMI